MKAMNRARPAVGGAGVGRVWRRRAEKRDAVRLLLASQDACCASDRDLARRLGVSHQLVAVVRRELAGAHGQPAARQARRGTATYPMNTSAINAVRMAERAEAERVSQNAVAVERRREQAASAYQAMRTRIAQHGVVTAAGLRVLERVEWRVWADVQRFEAEVSAAGQRFIQGAPGAAELFQAALARCEWAWARVFAVLRQQGV